MPLNIRAIPSDLIKQLPKTQNKKTVLFSSRNRNLFLSSTSQIAPFTLIFYEEDQSPRSSLGSYSQFLVVSHSRYIW